MAEIEGTADPDNLNGSFEDDRIYGHEADDVLAGGDGDDVLYGGDGSDALSGGTGHDVILGDEGDDAIDGGADDDSIFSGEGDDTIEGGTGRDTYYAPDSDGSVIVDLDLGTATGNGNDSLSGIENIDGSFRNDVLSGDEHDNRIDGRDGADRIYGGEGNDQLYGGFEIPASDRLDGGGGDDLISVCPGDFADGGPGIDTLWIELWGSVGYTIDLSALWSGGTAQIGTGTVAGFERLSYVLGSAEADTITLGSPGAETPPDGPLPVRGRGGDDRLTGGGDADRLSGDDGDDIVSALAGDDLLTGYAGNDRIEGGDGDDQLEGGSGTDDLIGGAGSDTYIYYRAPGFSEDSPASDRIEEEADAAGTDKIYFFTVYQHGDAEFAGVANVEVAELIAMADTGGAEFVLGAVFEATGIRHVIASADIDASQVAGGLDMLIKPHNPRNLTVTGSSGDDVFAFDRSRAHHSYVQTVDGGAGVDTVRFATRDEALQLLSAVSSKAVILTGIEVFALDAGPQAVALPDAPDRAGEAQSYTLALTDAAVAAGTRLTIDARTLRTDLIVSLGADGELGGTGANADSIGSDRLTVNASALTGERAVTVLAGATADSLTGSAGDDVLFGGAGTDALDGGAGHDRLDGDEGDDALDGGEGNDLIEGGAGADRITGGAGDDQLAGGAGDDIYVVDSAEDVVVEMADMGDDTVRSSSSFSLSDHVEQLVLTGGANNHGAGNALANTITGNNGNNRLDGGAGADALAGGAGHDTYVVDQAGDRVVEEGSSGNDTVESAVAFHLPTHVEKLTLTGRFGYDGRGNSGANAITGNSGSNFLNGGRGNDLIDGGDGNDWLMGHFGNDRLEGGAGDDRFYFNVAAGGADADRILDFSAADDSVYLLRSVFGAAGSKGMLDAAAFHQGTSAADAGDRILYDAATGNIFYDADGTGAAAALLVATVDPGTPLSHADFVIYG